MMIHRIINLTLFMTFRSAALCLLIGCFLRTDARITNFNCTETQSISIFSPYSFRENSGTIQSPCYPRSYTTCPPVSSDSCAIRIYTRTHLFHSPFIYWIGLYINAKSADYTGDSLNINNQASRILGRNTSYAINSIRHDDNGGFFHRHYADTFDFPETKIYFGRKGPPYMGDRSFTLNYKVAYVIGNELPRYTHEEGFIVSHKNFDYGDTDYDPDSDTQIRLDGTRGTLRITFLYFRVNYQFPFWSCSDFLEIIISRENKQVICGWKISDGEHIDVYPIDHMVTIRFVTVRGLSLIPSEEAGFLIQYEEVRGETCPPDNIQNADVTVINGTDAHIVTCKTGYRLLNGSAVQQNITCSADDDWTNKADFRPCIAMECDFPNMTSDGNLTFTFDSGYGLRINSTIRFSCEDERYTLRGEEMALCMNDGKWSSPPPTCELSTERESTTASATATSSSLATNDTPTKTRSEVDEKTHLYVVIGALGAVVVALVIALTAIIVKRKERISQSRRHNEAELVSAPHTADSVDYMTADSLVDQPDHIYSRPRLEDYENSCIAQRRHNDTGAATASHTPDSAGDYMSADKTEEQPDHIYSKPRMEDYENFSVT